jgi:hypothetical protein
MLSKTNHVSTALKATLDRNSDILVKFPLQQYIDYLDAYPDIQDYNVVSADVKQYCGRIADSCGNTNLDLYHRLLLCELINKAETQVKELDFPSDIRQIWLENIDSILDDLNMQTTVGDYLYPSDKLLKNLAICCLRLIPIGARKINLSMLPVKNFMFNKGLRQFLTLTYFIVTELRGIKPLYIGHLDTNDPNFIKEMNPEGLEKAYLRMAELLKRNKAVKGYFGTSWMLDPQLDKINLRHQYTRKMVLDNGGKLYYKGPSKSALRNSLAKSKTRRRLYKEGKYTPTNYVIVWSRQKLLRWAETAKCNQA